jgi:ADP-ribose pyrophosphatase
MLKRWKNLSTEILNKNPWTQFRHDRFEMPNGTQGDYYYLHSGGAAAIIPITADGKLVLNKQYRYLFNRDSIEFPSGGIKEGQTPEEAAHAELAEETGYKCGKLVKIGEVGAANGVYDEMTHIFIATELEETEMLSDETEEFEILKLTFDQVEELIQTNEIWDGFMLFSWALARHKIKELV